MDKRCGTCEWWEEFVREWGTCAAPVPWSVRKGDFETRETHASYGTECPCWKPAEAEAEREDVTP